jgi:hypothetical protein
LFNYGIFGCGIYRAGPKKTGCDDESEMGVDEKISNRKAKKTTIATSEIVR